MSFQQDEKGNKRWTVNGQYHREDGPAIEWVDGTKFWYQNGKKHRLHGPAIEWPNGDQEYFLHGNSFKKEDYLSLMTSLAKKEPFIISGNTGTTSVEYQNGITSYVLNGKYHREDGPAREYASGSKEWYLHGQRHRVDGPSIEWANGRKDWYLHGKLHREDGPAIEYTNGDKEWWIQDEKYSEQDWNIVKKKLSIEASSNKKKTTSTLPKAVKVTNIKKKSVKSKTSADKKKLVDSTQPMMTIDEYGTKCWKLNDQLHREDGPAIEYADGAKWWYRHGDLHREDGPAIEYANGDTSWYLNNKLHREDGPALESTEGLKCWFLQGKAYTEKQWKKKVSAMKKKDVNSKTASHEATDSTQPVMEVDQYGIKRWKLNSRLHREDGPAVVYTDDHKEWYYHGQLHREDGPAVEYPSGDKVWYLHGRCHREAGPAIEYANGTKFWYLHGQRHREDGPAVERAHGSKLWFLKGKKYTEAEWKNKVSAMKKKDINSKTASHEAIDSTQPMMTIDEDGTKYWKLNGQLHREDGPAVEWFNGRKDWYLHDKFHREDGPALEYTGGSKFWYLHDKLHRVDGPAIEWANGDKYWYLHGKLHREDGPAIEWCNGDKKWYLQGKEYTEEEYQKTLFPAINTVAKPADSTWQHLTSDLSHGTFRVAAKTIPKTARTALLAFLKTKKVKKSWLISAEEMMSTEWGLAFIQQALAWSFRYLPQLKEDPRATALANEWAIDSVAIIGNEVTQELATYFTPIISQVMELPTSNIRVSPLTFTDRSLEEEEIETMETLQQQATS